MILCDAAAEQPSDGKVGIAVRNLSVPEALSTVTVTAYLDSRTADGVWSEGVASTNVSSGTATLVSPATASGLSFSHKGREVLLRRVADKNVEILRI